MPGPPNSELNPLLTLQATNNASGGKVDPKTVVDVANHASSVGEATDNIQAIAHSGNMVKMFDTLHSMDVSHQASAWTALSAGEQNGLRSLGYTPPNPDHLSHSGAGGGGGGLWGDIIGGLDAARHFAAHGLDDVAHAGSDTLNALGAPLRAVQHVYRAGQVLAERGVAEAEGWGTAYRDAAGSGISFDPNQMRDLFNPSDWAQAWDATTNGNTQIDPAIYRHLAGQHGTDAVNAAIRVAAVGNPNSYINSLPQSRRQTAINQLNDPKFQQLVTQVANARLSVGQMVVGEHALTKNPGLGHAVSGAIDGGLDLVSDPALIGGKGLEAAKIIRWGIRNADDARALMSTPGFQRLVARAAPYLERGDYGGLKNIHPGFDGIAEALQRAGVDNGTKLQDFLSNVGGMEGLLAGQASKMSHGVTIMPHLSWIGWQRQGIKDLLSNSIDKLNDTRFKSGLQLDPQDLEGAGDHAALGANDQRFNDMVNLLERGKVAGGVGNIRGVSNVARLVKAMSTYVPSTAGLSVGEGSADVTNFRRMIQGYLPKSIVDDTTNLFISSDEAKRRTLTLAAMRQQAHAAGLYNYDKTSGAADKIFEAIEEENRRQAYGVDGYDRTPDDYGVHQPHALYETQTSHNMKIVLPSVMRSLARSNSVLDLAGVHPMDVVDRTMLYWRSLVLDRPGFAVRVALDENLNRLIRDPRGFFGSMLANGAARTRSDGEISAQVKEELGRGQIKPADVDARTAALKGASYKQILPYHPVDRVLTILGNRAPEGVRNNWKTLEQFYGGVMGATTRKWARQAEGKFLTAMGMGDYINAATHLAEHQPGFADNALQDIIAHTTGSDGYTVTPGSLVKMLRDGNSGKMAMWRKAGPYTQAGPGDPLYRYKWQVALDQMARSKTGQAVLHSINKPRNTQIDAVMHVLQNPEFAAEKQIMDRSVRSRSGALVGRDASQSQVDRDWAKSIVDNTNAHLRSGVYTPGKKPGKLISELVDHMTEHGAGPDEDLLDEVMKAHQVPAAVVGPDMLPVHKFEGLLSRSFEEMVGKPMNWMARQPHVIHQYAQALDPARSLAREAGMVLKGTDTLSKAGEQYASDVALHRTVNAILPYIHNPDLRTQFEDMHRNIFPFLFAQRQFLMRWGRTFADSPSGIRELQLVMNGLRSTGIVKKDANGNDYFYYPGSQHVSEMIAGAMNMIGVHASIPFATPFTGQVKYMMPGLANPVTPSVGPFVSIGMKELAKLFPEMTSFNTKILGQGVSESNWQQFTPTVLNRLYEALGPEQAGSQLASATAMQLKYMAAANQIPGQNAGKGDIETFISRLTQGARSILLTRAALGFVLPATPTAELDPKGLDARYKQLLTVLPYNQAYLQFIKEHPDAWAYTISDTQGATSGAIPATQQVLDFTNAHTAFAKNYPAAFPWIAPRSPGQFSLSAYLEQGATGQRNPLPMWDPNPGSKSIMADIINAKASSEYYKVVDQYDTAYGSTTDPSLRKQYTLNYDQWKQQFEARNPMFTEYINSQQGMRDREDTIHELRSALSDPQLPDSPAITPMKAMFSVYDDFKAAMDPLTGQNGTAAYDVKQQYKNNTIAWGNNYIKSHPQVADFWNTIMRPQIDETK